MHCLSESESEGSICSRKVSMTFCMTERSRVVQGGRDSAGSGLASDSNSSVISLSL